MNSKYVPQKGYFDLTHRPKGMSVDAHRKLIRAQMVIRTEAPKYKDDTVRKNNQKQFLELQELAGEYQYLYFSYYGLEEMGGVCVR